MTSRQALRSSSDSVAPAGLGGVVEEEGHRHRDLDLLPLGVVQREVRVEEVPLGNLAELALGGPLPGEEEVAGAADAHELPRVDIDDVGVLLRDQGCAHLASLARPGLGSLRLLETTQQLFGCALTGRRAFYKAPKTSTSEFARRLEGRLGEFARRLEGRLGGFARRLEGRLGGSRRGRPTTAVALVHRHVVPVGHERTTERAPGGTATLQPDSSWSSGRGSRWTLGPSDVWTLRPASRTL